MSKIYTRTNTGEEPHFAGTCDYGKPGVDDCRGMMCEECATSNAPMSVHDVKAELERMANGKGYAVGFNELIYGHKSIKSLMSYEVYIAGSGWHHRKTWREALDSLRKRMDAQTSEKVTR